jgi:hypothetical protein
MGPWGYSAWARPGGPASMWPPPLFTFPVAAPALPGLYPGYYAGRQSRFYLRSLRRDGVYLGDLSTVVLWAGNGDGNGCAVADDSSPWD